MIIEHYWLVELFVGDGTGESAGFYHTGFTDVSGHSRTTSDSNEARRYSKETAEYVAGKLGSTISGTWRATKHRFCRMTVKEMSGVVAEYYAAYEEAQDRAARMIWQSIQHGPDGAPDWLCEEFRRPSGSWYFHREGNRKECVSTDPFKWGKDCGEAGHEEGRCGNASCLK